MDRAKVRAALGIITQVVICLSQGQPDAHSETRADRGTIRRRSAAARVEDFGKRHPFADRVEVGACLAQELVDQEVVDRVGLGNFAVTASSSPESSARPCERTAMFFCRTASSSWCRARCCAHRLAPVPGDPRETDDEGQGQRFDTKAAYCRRRRHHRQEAALLGPGALPPGGCPGNDSGRQPA